MCSLRYKTERRGTVALRRYRAATGPRDAGAATAIGITSDKTNRARLFVNLRRSFMTAAVVAAPRLDVNRAAARVARL